MSCLNLTLVSACKVSEFIYVVEFFLVSHSKGQEQLSILRLSIVFLGSVYICPMWLFIPFHNNGLWFFKYIVYKICYIWSFCYTVGLTMFGLVRPFEIFNFIYFSFTLIYELFVGVSPNFFRSILKIFVSVIDLILNLSQLIFLPFSLSFCCLGKFNFCRYTFNSTLTGSISVLLKIYRSYK